MNNVTHEQTPDGVLIATPFLRCSPGSYGDNTQLRLCGHLSAAGGKRSIFLQASQPASGSAVILHDRIALKDAPLLFHEAAASCFEVFGTELMAELYPSDPSSLEEEKDLLGDWKETSLDEAHDRWIAREDARIFGKIQRGDFVILKKTFPGMGQIFRFDKSAWRNEIAFIDPNDDTPSSIGRFRFETYRPRRLSNQTIKDLDLSTGSAPSSKGAWSSHQLLQMIEENQKNAGTSGKEIYAFN